VVLAGTLWPLALEGLNGAKISVGAPYFNSAAGPLALILMSLLAAGPLLRWRSDRPAALLRRMAPALLVTALTMLALALFAGPIGILPFAGLVVAALVATASVAPLWKRNLARTPLFTWGMVIAHLGCAVSLAGMASDAAFTKENLVALRQGEASKVGPFEVTFAGLREVPGPNYASLEGVLLVRKGEGAPFFMLPHLRQFSDPPMLTNQAAIRTFWNGQLYLTIGEKEMEGRWLVRMWWKPFVTLIWLGGMMMALGGGLAMLGRVKRDLFAKGQRA
jgi:cytochrome c-type biogenesis protein CcmF